MLPWQRREPSQGPPSSRASSGRGSGRPRSAGRARRSSGGLGRRACGRGTIYQQVTARISARLYGSSDEDALVHLLPGSFGGVGRGMYVGGRDTGDRDRHLPSSGGLPHRGMRAGSRRSSSRAGFTVRAGVLRRGLLRDCLHRGAESEDDVRGRGRVRTVQPCRVPSQRRLRRDVPGGRGAAPDQRKEHVHAALAWKASPHVLGMVDGDDR